MAARTRETDLLRRRAEILESLGTTAEAFRKAERSRVLTGPEWAAKENLDTIEFLLGEDEVPEAS